MVRASLQVITVIVVSALLGFSLSVIPPSKTPTPFSECDTYPVGSAPGSCGPLGLLLIVVALALFSLAALYVIISRRHRSHSVVVATNTTPRVNTLKFIERNGVQFISIINPILWISKTFAGPWLG